MTEQSAEKEELRLSTDAGQPKTTEEDGPEKAAEPTKAATTAQVAQVALTGEPAKKEEG